MAENTNEQHHHHHHHHHHHNHRQIDDATLFKIKALASIENKKKLAKWAFRILCVFAVLMFLAVLFVYNFN